MYKLNYFCHGVNSNNIFINFLRSRSNAYPEIQIVNNIGRFQAGPPSYMK